MLPPSSLAGMNGMRTWRIANEAVALDRNCEGARKSGGHWHEEGIPALYAAMTVELAVLEKLVHCERDEPDLVLVAIDLPDEPALGLDMHPDMLPKGWDDIEDAGSAAAFGTVFLKRCSHLYLRVPSVVVREGWNLIVNPLHPAYAQVRLGIARPFGFDPRLFRVA